ncbi:mannitol dehydrogenase family protein [Streptomyces sp. WMMB 322]|uniref:mannitol dehydrogenase family protein n=1 Tax=Streptomyces sp. WMMB 322 TaxID=1286821 RepID=UPI0006E3BD6F|nr:mannitol dehydrogenase family protein [Streptomyces sp. WMMB 322]SCK45663.1 fructuronate reductase [Streptomyces sp. WMMB 322]
MSAQGGAPRILHLGLGNFHRAHQALCTEDAGLSGQRWEITGVAGSSRNVVEALHRQRMRYSVVTLGPEQTSVRQVASVTDAFVAADEPHRVTREVADPRTRVVSLTVTEKGYDISPLTRRLDLDAPGIRGDLDGGAAPRSTIGRLAAGLLRRARESGAPVTLLSCDNVTANGTTLAGLLRDFAAALPLQDGAELLGYLDESVTCPDTMVDRIVPATTDVHRRLAAEAGHHDEVPVPAEPFWMWVMRDRFAAGRPAWDSAGAVMTDRVHDYETVKVRLLNGSHSLLAYLGLLTGRSLIADAAVDPAIARAVRLLGDEYEPTLTLPDGFDVAAYREQLGERFANRRLAHRTTQVGADGSLKLAQRVPGAALWHLERGRVPAALALTVAAWLRCTAYPEQLDAGRTGVPVDPNGERIRALAGRTGLAGGSAQRARSLARASLCDQAVLGRHIAEQGEFVDRVAELLALVETGGPAAALGAVCGGGPPPGAPAPPAPAAHATPAGATSPGGDTGRGRGTQSP